MEYATALMVARPTAWRSVAAANRSGKLLGRIQYLFTLLLKSFAAFLTSAFKPIHDDAGNEAAQ